MRALSVFSGCGGLDIAAEAAGIAIVGQIEYESACVEILERHWPDTPRWEDVRSVKIDEINRICGTIDMVFGGPPCQPVSVAGSRGAAGDSRNMWPEFLRILRGIKPRWIVAENPTGIFTAQKFKGDTREWPKGEFFGEIVRDITAMGYRAGWGVWGACDMENDAGGAAGSTESSPCPPHQRERMFLVAHCPGIGRGAWRPDATGFGRETGIDRRGEHMADAHHPRLEGREREGLRECADERAAGAQRASLGHAERGRQHGKPRRGAGPEPADGYPCASAPMGHAEGERRDRAGEDLRGRREFTDDGGRPFEPGLGGSSHGHTHWLDDIRWPAGRVEGGYSPQFGWEPPRVVPGKSVARRAARLKMLGNMVVPEQARILFDTIIFYANEVTAQ